MPQDQEPQSVVWAQDMQDDSLDSAVGEDDFSKFLDLDTDFQFSGLDHTASSLDHAPSGLDTPMGRLGFDPPPPQQTTMQSLGFNGSQLSLDSHLPSSQPFEPFQQQYPHMQLGRNYHIPPTPVSSDMHPGKFDQAMDNGQGMFDGHPVSFTPLVSPAQTPLHGGFSLADYGSADDFFSPLTSPALEAQAQYGTGATASPGSTSARAAAPRSVGQSPVTRAQRSRRPQSSTNLALAKLNEGRVQPTQTLQPHVPGSQARASDDSVSPEPLEPVDPVTPATLMRIPSNQNMPPGAGDGVAQAPPQPMDEVVMEDMMLPAAAALTASTHSALDELDGGQEATPVLSAKSAKVSVHSTPRSSLPKTASQDSFTKPSSRADGRAGRGSKKRQSTSSAAISPALRPKISPGISPLVPASGPGMSHLSAETSALYLASKSNYQNIIDGTHLPGVSYPEALAENLSSKRTSHKLAEQGRRNRINLALKEIESLLPTSITAGAATAAAAAVVGKREKQSAASETEAGDRAAPSIQGASKASTVEMAIVYIKSLQAELKVTKDKLETAERKLADGGSSAGSQASD
ncbi:hypothetical protein DV737_g1129, partial [Chaetothyriales sp. CBS 132003]